MLLLATPLLLAVSALAQIPTPDSCPDGWSYSNLYFDCIKPHGKSKTWHEAKKGCEKEDSTLISIRNAFEQSSIVNILETADVSCQYFWIGAEWDVEKGAYIWTDDDSKLKYNNFDRESKGWNNTADSRLAINTELYTWDSLLSSSESCYICAQKLPESCQDLLEDGFTQSGTYEVQTFDYRSLRKKKTVLCDQSTTGGGWTVIQQRFDGNTPFWNSTWAEYRDGFGNIDATANFWIGNEYIHRITKRKDTSTLRVELHDDRNPNATHSTKFFLYGEYTFRLHDASTDYTLSIQSNNVGNASTGWYDITYNNGNKFSTVDRINDPEKECVTNYHLGGWWLHYCTLSTLNGEYVPPISYGNGYGMMWIVDGLYVINPRTSRMMTRPAATSGDTTDRQRSARVRDF
jgi:hypothetical protein